LQIEIHNSYSIEMPFARGTEQRARNEW